MLPVSFSTQALYAHACGVTTSGQGVKRPATITDGNDKPTKTPHKSYGKHIDKMAQVAVADLAIVPWVPFWLDKYWEGLMVDQSGTSPS